MQASFRHHWEVHGLGFAARARGLKPACRPGFRYEHGAVGQSSRSTGEATTPVTARPVPVARLHGCVLSGGTRSGKRSGQRRVVAVGFFRISASFGLICVVVGYPARVVVTRQLRVPELGPLPAPAAVSTVAVCGARTYRSLCAGSSRRIVSMTPHSRCATVSIRRPSKAAGSGSTASTVRTATSGASTSGPAPRWAAARAGAEGLPSLPAPLARLTHSIT